MCLANFRSITAELAYVLEIQLGYGKFTNYLVFVSNLQLDIQLSLRMALCLRKEALMERTH